MSETATLVELFSSIQGEGPYVGFRQAFLRFHGCNLDCAYCDTVQLVPPAVCRVEVEPGEGSFHELPNPVPLEKVVDIITSWHDRFPGLLHSISITGGEPLMFRDVLAEWLPFLRRHRPTYLETNGTLPDALAAVVEHLDYISMDIKLPSASGCAPLWDTHRKFLEVAAQQEVFVKTIIGPDTTEEEIAKVCRVIRDVDPFITLVLQPVTCGGASAVPVCKLLKLQEQAARHLGNVRVIPQTHVFLNLL
jgi:7-carboxy-7-deazaguanine synthase